MNSCDKCKRTFSTKSNLNTHKKTTKSCGQNPPDEKIVCEYCETEFATSRNLQRHQENCSTKKSKEKDLEIAKFLKEREEKDIEFSELLKEKDLEIKSQRLTIREKSDHIISLETELKTTKEYVKNFQDQIKDLQDRLDRFATKAIEKSSTTTSNNKIINNNTSVNITFFTQEHIDKQVKDNFSRDHLILGAKGVAKFTHEFLAKDGEKMIYVCTDPARQVFYFDAPDGSRTKDFKGTKLTKALQKPICDKSLKIVKDAGYAIEYLNELEKRNEHQEREMRLYKFAQERWTEISSEIVLLNDSNFVMELSKLIAM